MNQNKCVVGKFEYQGRECLLRRQDELRHGIIVVCLGKLQTGLVAITHTLLQSKNLIPCASRLISERFKNQIYAGTRQASVTAPALY